VELYFIRHGRADRAAWSGNDFERPLTPDGHSRIEKQARRLGEIGFDVDVIITSPLTRALQTAEIVADVLEIKDRLVIDDRLGFGFDLSAVRVLIAEYRDAGRIAFVGHEPSFSAVVGELIGGALVVCKKGCVARVDLYSRDSRHGELVWLLQPATLLK
jgi:phosphohistidine phosphatase